MRTRVEIETCIAGINEAYLDYIDYIDSLNYTDPVNEKLFTVSGGVVNATKKSAYTSVQYLEELKKNSLKEYELILQQDTTLFNLSFELYGTVDDDTFDKLITANDLGAFNRTDIDPNDPILHKGMKIIYYA